ncbi:MAG: hypothetical protein ACOH1Y_17310 [Propionicimonas sp.]
MRARPLTLLSVKPVTAAMLTVLNDGQWHPKAEVRAQGHLAAVTQERDATLTWAARIAGRRPQDGQRAEADLLDMGAKGVTYNRLDILSRRGRVQITGDMVRMTPTALTQWRATTDYVPVKDTAPKPAPDTQPAPTGTGPAVRIPQVDELPDDQEPTAQDLTPSLVPTPDRRARTRKPVIFGGVLEADGWAQAPLRTFDLVHFRLNHCLPLAELRAHLDTELNDTVSLTLDTDELYRVFVAPGDGPRTAELVTTWCADHNSKTTGLRTDLNRRRRNVRDLDPRYLDDLMTHYQGYGMRRLQKNMSSVMLHIPEYDDIQQQLAIWILEAIVRFDDTKGVPFGAWLSTALSKWVHDLNRSSFGRTVADAELKQHRAVAAFTAIEHRHPTETEFATLVGTSVAALRRSRQSVSVVNSLRACLSIDSGGLDDSELSIPARGNDPAEQLEEDLRPVIVSSVLTNACAPDKTAKLPSAREVNTVGWVTWYATMYKGQTRTDLAEELRTSMRNLHVHSERAGAVMAARMPEALGTTR